MSELELKNGPVFTYVDQYETIEACVSFSKTLEGFSAYKIRLNGKPVIISKEFKLIDDRLGEFIVKHQLQK